MTATEIRVRFHELDPYGHANHGVWLNWFETARIEIMDDLGLGPADLQARGIHLVVSQATIRFRQPALAGDVVTITSQIHDLRQATCWWHQQARRGHDLLATIDVRSGTVDPDGRPIRAPEDLRQALNHLLRASDVDVGAPTTTPRP